MNKDQVIEGLSGFSFFEEQDVVELTVETLEPQDTPVFAPAESKGEDPVLAIAMSSPMVGGIPLALCDDELMNEINSIPDRLAFKIGDVAELVGVKPYVLRYWQTEFEVLSPKKSKNNQRVYAKRDVENVMLIKKLLYRDRFSIEGARAALKSLRGQVKKERHIQTSQYRVDTAIDRIHEIHSEIIRLKKLFQ